MRRAAARILPYEADEQATFVAMFSWQYPGVLLYAIPNGTFLFGDAKRRAMQMVHLKRQGLRPGMPDLHVPEWRLWVELKRQRGGVTSDEQSAIHAQLRAIGDTVIVAAGADLAMAAIKRIRSGT